MSSMVLSSGNNILVPSWNNLKGEHFIDFSCVHMFGLRKILKLKHF